jgi:hypothetical protein
MTDDLLNSPPFPLLRWDKYAWEGEITLLSWAGFQTRRGWYAGRSSEKPSDGTARLVVASEGDLRPTPPSLAQSAAMRYLRENEVAVASAVLNAIFECYPREKEAYEDAMSGEEGATLPEITEPHGLRTVIGLSHVHVLSTALNDVAYMGFEFGCEWEEEHGCGVMTHLGRVVKVGYADHSFLDWIARRDAEGWKGASA